MWSLAELSWLGHSVEDNHPLLGHAHTIIWYPNHIKLSTCKWKVWTKFLITLSIGTTIMNIVICTKSCFECMFSVFSFHVLHLPSCKHKVWQPHIQGVAKDQGSNFVPGLSWKMGTDSMKILARRLFSQLHPIELMVNSLLRIWVE